MSHTTKFKVEKFDGKGNFYHWQSRMKDLLMQQGLKNALKGEKRQNIKDEGWEGWEERAMSMIRLSMADEILSNVLDEKTTISVWKKLESLYMTKSLSNKLIMKKQ